MQEWANEFEGEINGEGVGGSVKHNFVILGQRRPTAGKATRDRGAKIQMK